MSHVARLVVGRVEIVDTALQASVHDGEVLIGEGHIDHHLGVVAAEKGAHFLHFVGIDGVGADQRQLAAGLGGGLLYSVGEGVAFASGARSYHYLAEYFRILGAFVGYNAAHTSGADDDYFCHFFLEKKDVEGDMPLR